MALFDTPQRLYSKFSPNVFFRGLAFLLHFAVDGVAGQEFCGDDDCYDLLKLKQSATREEINKAYKKLTLQLHPDKNPDLDAHERYNKIVKAYEVLSSSVLRGRYDFALRNPYGYIDEDGAFVDQAGSVDHRLLLVGIALCAIVFVLVAKYVLNVQEFFAPPIKDKPKKAKKNGKNGTNGATKVKTNKAGKSP